MEAEGEGREEVVAVVLDQDSGRAMVLAMGPVAALAMGPVLVLV